LVVVIIFEDVLAVASQDHQRIFFLNEPNGTVKLPKPRKENPIAFEASRATREFKWDNRTPTKAYSKESRLYLLFKTIT
jgi:hypothetical protein